MRRQHHAAGRLRFAGMEAVQRVTPLLCPKGNLGKDTENLLVHFGILPLTSKSQRSIFSPIASQAI